MFKGIERYFIYYYYFYYELFYFKSCGVDEIL